MWTLGLLEDGLVLDPLLEDRDLLSAERITKRVLAHQGSVRRFGHAAQRAAVHGDDRL